MAKSGKNAGPGKIKIFGKRGALIATTDFSKTIKLTFAYDALSRQQGGKKIAR